MDMIAKKIILLLLLFSGMVCCGKEFVPEHLPLELKGRRLTGLYGESAYGLEVKTTREDDLLKIDFTPVWRGNGTVDFTIPRGIRRLALFGGEFILPETKGSIYFQSFLLENIDESSPQFNGQTESLRLISMVAVEPRTRIGTRFHGHNYYIDNFGEETRNLMFIFNGLITNDGGVYLYVGEYHYKAFDYCYYHHAIDFQNVSGKLAVYARERLAHYQITVERLIPFSLIDIPKPDPQLLTLANLNKSDYLKYLKKIAGKPLRPGIARKTVQEAELFYKQLNQLKEGMSPAQVENCLGKPLDGSFYRNMGKDQYLMRYGLGEDLGMFLYFDVKPDAPEEKTPAHYGLSSIR